MVTRAPVLQRDPTAFEREYYRFNVELANRLQQPFPRDLYFKKGSAAGARFDEYYTALQKTWEVKPETKGLANDAGKGVASSESDSTLYQTLPRTTEADKNHDTHSLERALDRTLYLVVSTKGAQAPKWAFPAQRLPDQRTSIDTLHGTAMNGVLETFGDTMDLWLTYILRARILAGKPAPASKDVDFAWLTKEEIQQRLADDGSQESSQYWEKIEGLLDP
ncbi:Mrpl17p [Malassezia vespertilionis]|uniref:Mrpl17p n=2 Tax=Malassezia vespertilionis TaxID=2020962 RepID=A0A2N1JGX5_9BASI|nr:Mrpl17p [Malassezia vespertilionis]